MAIIPLPTLRSYFFDNNGLPLISGKIFTYKAQTNIKKDTFTDSSGQFQNTNPVILDSEGSCDVWLLSDEAYRFEIFDNIGNLIYTIDNVLSLKGKNAGEIINIPGPVGLPGLPGLRGPIGPAGPAGPAGDPGSNGRVSYVFKTAGEHQIIIPNGVTQIEYVIGGGGGGFLANNGIQNVTTLATGTAGEIKRVTLDVISNDVIDVTIGAGGGVSLTESVANGKNSTLEKNSVLQTTVLGGKAGATFIDEPVDPEVDDSVINQYFNKLPRLIDITLDAFEIENPPFEFLPQKIFFIPNPVTGQSTIFGDGGDFVKFGNPNAQGNCSSGGCGETTRNGINTQISGVGTGAPGICIIEFNIT